MKFLYAFEKSITFSLVELKVFEALSFSAVGKSLRNVIVFSIIFVASNAAREDREDREDREEKVTKDNFLDGSSTMRINSITLGDANVELRSYTFDKFFNSKMFDIGKGKKT